MRKDILIAQLIGLWSQSRVQCLIVKINGGKKRKDWIKEKITKMLFRFILYEVYSQNEGTQNFSCFQHPIRLKIEPSALCFEIWYIVKPCISTSISVLFVWQVHKRPAVLVSHQFWYCVPYSWRLWRGRHLRNQRHLQRKERNGTENCCILANMKQQERSYIILLCGWWRCFVAPRNLLQSHPTCQEFLVTLISSLCWYLVRTCFKSSVAFKELATLAGLFHVTAFICF